MMNEEIEVKTKEVVARIKGAKHSGQIEDAVYEGLFDLVSKAYEETARATCVDCRYDAPCYLERGRWQHPEGECRATAIRGLKGSLVSEPVAS